MTSSLTVASKNSSSSTASCCSCFSASNAISCCQWLKHDIWEYIDALDQVSCCQRLFPNRSKFVWRITSGGMPNRAVVEICTSAIHGWIQNLIRNKSVYDCYRQSLIFGKIKNSLTNTADVREFSKTSNFVMTISQEVSEIWKNVSYQIYRAEKNNMWTSVWKTKKNMILALKYAYILLMVSGTVSKTTPQAATHRNWLEYYYAHKWGSNDTDEPQNSLHIQGSCLQTHDPKE